MENMIDKVCKGLNVDRNELDTHKDGVVCITQPTKWGVCITQPDKDDCLRPEDFTAYMNSDEDEMQKFIFYAKTKHYPTAA